MASLLKSDEINKLQKREDYETYFDVMNISKEQKLERIELAELLDDVFLFLFVYADANIETSAFDIEDLYEIADRRYLDALENYGIDLDKHPQIKEYASKMSRDIIDSVVEKQNKTIDEVHKNTSSKMSDKRVIDNAKGQTASGNAISGIEEKEEHASNVAKNEANTVLNMFEYDNAISSGYTTKTWFTENDDKVRYTHRSIDGQTIAIDGVFLVGESQMRFPKDSGLGANPKEFVNCRCSLKYGTDNNSKSSDEDKSSLLKKESEDDIISSGAISGALNPLSDEAEKHAIRYYGFVRAMSTDTEKIAKNTNFEKSDIDKIKNYIFVEKHDLGGNEPENFTPNYFMAESWRRLIDGKYEPHDITMLRHELLEMKYVEEGKSQDEAHIMASKKFDYKAESDKYYDNAKKH